MFGIYHRMPSPGLPIFAALFWTGILLNYLLVYFCVIIYKRLKIRGCQGCVMRQIWKVHARFVAKTGVCRIVLDNFMTLTPRFGQKIGVCPYKSIGNDEKNLEGVFPQRIFAVSKQINSVLTI